MRAAGFGAVLLLTTTVVAAGSPAHAADPALARATGPAAEADLGVLFVGAHPDDEASLLSTFGLWGHEHGVRSGVATITRGEGGGNAVGPEEGPALGLLREAEERRAVAGAGVTDVYNLDEPDLYYTVSAPLTEQAWGHDDVLGKLVRVVRQTRPEVVVTMDPAPTPGNHGNHQYAARLALEAYRLAADPAAFPEQIDREGLGPWSVRRVLSNAAGADEEFRGPDCESRTAAAGSPGPEYFVWGGRRAPGGITWEQRERLSEREYATQGWASRPDVPDDPAEIGCDHFTELANRTPHVPGARGPEAPLLGALLPAPGGLPLGTAVSATAERSHVIAGERFGVRVGLSAGGVALPGGTVALELPPGWQVQGDGSFAALPPGASAGVGFTVAVPADQRAGRVPVPVRVVSGAQQGTTELRLDVVPPVVAEQAPLPAVADFQRWTGEQGLPALRDAVAPVWTIPAGGAREVPVIIRNHARGPQSGVVRLEPPAGFAVGDPERRFDALAPGATESAVFDVRSTDPHAPTGMRGGDRPYALTAQPDGGQAARTASALEVVPATAIPATTTPPAVDGRAGAEEYPGPTLDLSARWEGDECASHEDCSATAKLARHGDVLHVLVDVVDDVRGRALSARDCKRHWRTDAVEIAIDPKGGSENTSSTLKLAVLPRTEAGPPCHFRDADNHQGPGPETAPGVRIASVERHGGYTVEASIPLSALPGSVDPARMGLDLLVYDSDTDDLTGQTRIGWSAWGGVQGDPYRWGRAMLEGLPGGEQVPAPEPRLPLDALASVDSPGSLAQSVRLGTAPGGARPAGDSAARLVDARTAPGEVRAKLVANAPGTVHVFVLDAAGVVVADQVVPVQPGERQVVLPVPHGSGSRVLAGFATPDGATAASAADVR
ncbi:PIG-L family deacetylase [Saccharopolyspora erythraea]|uniref:sugar-binding protein n=1 Tax=Saccharopolyspora erythraea TaxID=1836 RepID=UPI001BA841EB|nr:sugar-binding protein [Saccharopolyspora erythraea]QUH03181.1 PIG-L family deacetylase [Saccharopolyspora erythraea]